MPEGWWEGPIRRLKRHRPPAGRYQKGTGAAQVLTSLRLKMGRGFRLVMPVTTATDPRHALQSDEITRVGTLERAGLPAWRHLGPCGACSEGPPPTLADWLQRLWRGRAFVRAYGFAPSFNVSRTRGQANRPPAAPESRSESEEPLLNSNSRYPIPLELKVEDCEVQ